MASLQPHLTSLLESLPPSPIDQSKLSQLVKDTVLKTKDKSSPENRKVQWEYLLKNDIFLLAATEGSAVKEDETKYYNALCDKMDIILTFTEQDGCEQTFPLMVLQDLLETQTIASCSHIFSWIEKRAARLTEGMVPQKGKALVLLRTLNDLLRRLSKMGNTTIFCGRILTFLSGVFPLGERSGVNLRGEYGPQWEPVHFSDKPKQKDGDMNVDDPQADSTKGDKASEGDHMDIDGAKAPAPQSIREKKEDLYNTFWSLQLPFSRPPLFSKEGTFPSFKEAVSKVMPVIKEATAKERAMMGSRGGVGSAINLKRKREPEENNSNEYFFAKFLTSPDLLDLEIADTHFRRQFLFQLLTILHHLLNFTKAAKAAWTSTRNRSLQMDFTLEDPEVQWVQETMTKVVEELKQTTPNGRIFADTVVTILERERNWVKWKNELCTPFDKEPWREMVNGVEVGLFEATKNTRTAMRAPPEEWKWKYGTEPLTEIWEMGYARLDDLKLPFQTGDVKDFVKKIKQEDARIGMRKQRQEKMALLARNRAAAAANASAASIAPVNPPPSIVVSTEPSEVINSDELITRPEAVSINLAAPRPVPAVGSSPIHPSLPPKPGSPAKFASSSQESARAIGTSTTNVASVPPASTSTPVPTPAPIILDEEIAKYEENKHRWAWLALRASRDQYLQHFSKIGTGDIEILAQEIEKEKEKALKGEDNSGGGTAEEQAAGSPPSTKTRRYKVVSVDNNHNSNRAALDRVSQLSKSELPANATDIEKESTDIDAHICDLTKPEQIRAVFEKYGKGGIWGVIHIAAYKAVGESTEIPLTYYANNVGATISLLQVMSEYDCNRIVYSSSATVYGTPPVIPIPESTRLKAHSPYGKTKVMSETIIDDLCHSDKKWRALSLRYFNPAGAHPSGKIGEDPRGRPGNLLPLLAHMAVGRVKDATLKVFGNDYPTPDGTCVRDYLHIMDLASGHVLALDALGPDSTVFDLNAEAFYKAYNLGKGKGMSVLQIVDAMRKATGFDYKYEIIGRRRGDVPDLTADPSLAEKELGFRAPADLETMCRDLWNWQSNNPNGYSTE
ncbi:THO complex subunit 1 transcription elongation factor-domain-containing protein [Gymnopilus junonius]|uniref:THO complex subunit 1 transcription elongation factor-domain-containing protein n=1 Tax=Gymnopilus junonius TaxID=109634 RepID=A0A9P5NZ12_GYMJU|nr:THO complex subunit 1 transcription elongation factor-domain-containing protein [Gymnopilus junonius]